MTTYLVTADRIRPAHTTALALALCACLAASGTGQALARIGISRRSAAVILALDLLLFLGLAGLYAFDPHDDLFVLMFLFVIEAGLTLGGRGAPVACGVAMLGYAAVGAVSGDSDGIPADLPVTVLWYGLLMVVAGMTTSSSWSTLPTLAVPFAPLLGSSVVVIATSLGCRRDPLSPQEVLSSPAPERSETVISGFAQGSDGRSEQASLTMMTSTDVEAAIGVRDPGPCLGWVRR